MQLLTCCRRLVQQVDDVLMDSYTEWPTFKPHLHYHVTILASYVYCGARDRDEWLPSGGCTGGGHSPSSVAQFPFLPISSLSFSARILFIVYARTSRGHIFQGWLGDHGICLLSLYKGSEPGALTNHLRIGVSSL